MDFDPNSVDRQSEGGLTVAMNRVEKGLGVEFSILHPPPLPHFDQVVE